MKRGKRKKKKGGDRILKISFSRKTRPVLFFFCYRSSLTRKVEGGGKKGKKKGNCHKKGSLLLTATFLFMMGKGKKKGRTLNTMFVDEILLLFPLCREIHKKQA